MHQTSARCARLASPGNGQRGCSMLASSVMLTPAVALLTELKELAHTAEGARSVHCHAPLGLLFV